MKISHQQLEAHLNKNLAALYFISGDEHLLVQETADQVRTAARKAGYSERTSVHVDPGADWGKLLYTESHSLSLFATKRIVELHLGSAKPTAANSKILQDIAARPLTDTILIISCNKLDSKVESTAWFKAIDKGGVTITIWPIPAEQMPAWVSQRAKKMGLNMTADAAKLLADQVEGNLLAAAQELEKLCLLQINGTIDHNIIGQAVTDNAQFDIFALVDCALSGNSKRCLRMLDNLKAEDTEPLIILWALMREVRTLAEIIKQTKQSIPLNNLFTQYRIWEKRQPQVRRFLQHHTQQSCWAMLSHGAYIDNLIKGAASGDIWLELQQLTLKIAGSVILPITH